MVTVAASSSASQFNISNQDGDYYKDKNNNNNSGGDLNRELALL